MRDINIPPLDLSATRPISPGGCPSAGDFEMGSPRSWCGSLVLPDRPRTSESRRPSFSSNVPGSYPPNAWRIQPGSYVAFSLAPTELANHYPPDSNAARALLTFRGQRYIGLVVGSYVCKSADDTHWIEDLAVLYVSDMPPPIPEAAGFFVPIAPFNVEGVETRGRKPIKTKDMFPLKDRVQWTTFGTRLQIETFVESTLSFKMDDDEFTQVESIVSADLAALADCPPSNVLDKLRVPVVDALPATVWRDIRGEHRTDPAEFVLEVYESTTPIIDRLRKPYWTV